MNSCFNCIYCGKFIKWNDFETGNAIQHFIPDSEVSREELYAWHTKCESGEKCLN